MGWYDAFRGNQQRVNVNAITSDSGSAAKNFGDAFTQIGKNMLDVEEQRRKDTLTDKEIDVADSRIKNQNAQTATNEYSLESAKKTDEQKRYDDAFKAEIYATPDRQTQKDILEFEAPDPRFDNNISADAFKEVRGVIEANERKAQDLFNTEAKKLALNNQWGDYKSFVAANPDVIEHTDAATDEAIMGFFNKDEQSKAAIEAERERLKYEQKIAKAKNEQIKAEQKFSKESTVDPVKFSKYIRDTSAMQFDKNGDRVLDEDTKADNDFLETVGMAYLKDGIASDFNEARMLAAQSLEKKKAEEESLKQRETLGEPETKDIDEQFNRLFGEAP